MSGLDACLTRSRGLSGEQVVRFGEPLLDDYLDFLAGRCRPNTVLAAAHDLKVFFTVITKAPAEVCPADVLGFVTAQRTGRVGDPAVVQALEDGRFGGVSTSTVARRQVARCRTWRRADPRELRVPGRDAFVPVTWSVKILLAPAAVSASLGG